MNEDSDLLTIYCIQNQLMIAVFLRKSTGKGEKLQVQPKSTAAALLREIAKALDYEEQSRISCFHRGVKIDPSEESIEDLGITASSILHVLQEKEEEESKQEVVVKLIIRNKLLEYEIGTELRVQDLKETISQDLEIKEEDLTLSYLGIELIDSKSIKEYRFTQGVLISASVSGDIPSLKFAETYSVSKQAYSQESQGIPKIVKSITPRKKIKKAESLNMQPAFDLKGSRNFNYSSARLNKIQQKNDESKVESQINESQEISQETSEIQGRTAGQQKQKPKMTLDLLSKPWYGDQKIIETESIVGDEDSQQTFSQCLLELTRVDKKRRYVLECGGQHTFQDAVKTLARLEKTQSSSIKLLINFDEVSKSGIEAQSSKGITKSPRSCESIKRQRSSHQGGRLSLLRHQGGMKGSIVDKAAKAKSKVICLQYQSYAMHAMPSLQE